MLKRMLLLSGAVALASAATLPTDYPFVEEVSQEAEVRQEVREELAQIGATNLQNLTTAELLTKLDGAAKLYVEKNPDIFSRLKDAFVKAAESTTNNHQFVSGLIHTAGNLFNVTLNDSHVQAAASNIAQLIPTGAIESLLPQATSLLGALPTDSLGNINPSDTAALASLMPQASDLLNQFVSGGGLSGLAGLFQQPSVSAAALESGVEDVDAAPTSTEASRTIDEGISLRTDEPAPTSVSEEVAPTDLAESTEAPVSQEDMNVLLNDLLALLGSGELTPLVR